LSPKEREAINEFWKHKHQWREGMRTTNRCMAKRARTGNPSDSDDCEVISLSEKKLFTFHTHPHGKLTPSGLDIQTQERSGRAAMCIGMAPTGEVVCYDMHGKRILSRGFVGK